MDKDLRYLLHLYGEAPPPENVSEMDSEEARALAEMKSLLDQRPRLSPSESVIRDVLASAGPDVPVRASGRAMDRPAVRGRALTRRLAATGSGILLVLLAALIVLWTVDERGVDVGDNVEMSAASNSHESPSVAESPFDVDTTIDSPQIAIAARSTATREGQQEARRETPRFDPPVQVVSATGSSPAVEQTLSGLAWDDADDLRDVHRMINVVQSRGHDIEWDEPAVPLELLGQPGNPTRPGVRQAGYPGNVRERP